MSDDLEKIYNKIDHGEVKEILMSPIGNTVTYEDGYVEFQKHIPKEEPKLESPALPSPEIISPIWSYKYSFYLLLFSVCLFIFMNLVIKEKPLVSQKFMLELDTSLGRLAFYPLPLTGELLGMNTNKWEIREISIKKN